jgi:hypothetical protein
MLRLSPPALAAGSLSKPSGNFQTRQPARHTKASCGIVSGLYQEIALRKWKQEGERVVSQKISHIPLTSSSS